MRKGEIPSFLLIIVAFIIVLFVTITLLQIFGGEGESSLRCALGFFQFTGCPGGA